MKKYHLIMLMAAVATAGCQSAKKLSSSRDSGLQALATLMMGQFSSEQQARADTNYFHVNLDMSRIWQEREDGIWLYVEQAMAGRLDKPYRQRVYHLQHPAKESFTSDIYTLKNAAAVAGAQSDPAKMALLTFDNIELKEGCTVTLQYRRGIYEGGTEGTGCPSDLRGARYTTSKITLKPGVLESWDQGFDAAGKQVWGATGGGYIFIKKM